MKKWILGALVAIVVTAAGAGIYNHYANAQAAAEVQAAAAGAGNGANQEGRTGQGAIVRGQAQPDAAAGLRSGDSLDVSPPQGQVGTPVEDPAAQGGRWGLAAQDPAAQDPAAAAGPALTAAQGGGYGRGRGGQGRQGRAAGGNPAAVPGLGEPTGPLEPDPQNGMQEWVTLAGTVSAYAPPYFDLVTQDGQTVPVQIGNQNYLSSLGLNLQDGSQVTVVGFWETTGSFAVGQLTLAESGQTFTFRDELGRPLWSGGAAR